jgi:uncharacterized protein (TIGR00730 family)
MKKKSTFIKREYNSGNPKLDDLVKQLVEAAGPSENSDFIQEIIYTALKLNEDGFERGDIKMINVAMKELRYALKVFYPYAHIRKVAIFGSARTPETSPDYKIAKEFSKAIVDAGWMVVTGASSGIMSAGNEGAGRANSFGVNIRLPFEQSANPYIIDDSKLINFKYFFTRKLIFIRESDATVLCPGGFGTHDEGFETLTLIQTGKAAPRPVVCLDPPKSTYWSSMRTFLKNQLAKKKMIDFDDLGLIHFTHDPYDAVRMITHFYRNYHSSRYIGDRLIFRLKSALPKAKIEKINQNYKSILAKGKIQQYTKPFEEEQNEPHTFGLTRLALYFNRRHFAKLNQLINEVNEE